METQELEETYEDIELEEQPEELLSGKLNSDMVMVCTLVINNIPVMYEWLPKKDADIRVKQIYRDEINDVYR